MDKTVQEILFSQAVKAGKRIYYLDVKRNSNGEPYLAITESKKIVTGEGDTANVTFEKHKIFLYREDFDKFATALSDVMKFVEDSEKSPETESENSAKTYDIDINFDL